MGFFSEYFACHFYFLWPKNLRIIFAPKTILCSRLFSNFYRFYLRLCVFRFLWFGKMFLAYCFNSYNFVTATIFLKTSSTWLIASLFPLFSAFSSRNVDMCKFISLRNLKRSKLESLGLHRKILKLCFLNMSSLSFSSSES